MIAACLTGVLVPPNPLPPRARRTDTRQRCRSTPGRPRSCRRSSAGRIKPTKVRPGNPYLKSALGLTAFGAVRTKDTYLQARYKRLTARRGPLMALVAVEHSIATAIWHMLTDNVPYRELGGSYFTQRDPERATRRAITQFNQLGYTVTLNPIEGAARPPTDQAPGGLNDHRAASPACSP